MLALTLRAILEAEDVDTLPLTVSFFKYFVEILVLATLSSS